MQEPLMVGITGALITVLGGLVAVYLGYRLQSRHSAKAEDQPVKGPDGKKKRDVSGRFASILLFATWWVLVGIMVTVIHVFVEGVVLFGHKLHFDVLRILAVVGVALIDLLIRWGLFRRIQSISLGILVFATAFRLVTTLVDCVRVDGGAPAEWDVYIIVSMFVLLALGGGVYWVYRDTYIRGFTKWLNTRVSKTTTKLSSESQAALGKIAVSYKHVDLWGIFQEEEASNLRQLLNGMMAPGDEFDQHSDFALPFPGRLAVVVVLSILPVIAVYLNALA